MFEAELWGNSLAVSQRRQEAKGWLDTAVGLAPLPLMLSTVWRAAAKSILLVKTRRLMGVEAIAQRHLLHLGGPGFQAHLSYFVYRCLNTCYKTPGSPFLGAKLREASVLMALRSAVEKTSILYSSYECASTQTSPYPNPLAVGVLWLLPIFWIGDPAKKPASMTIHQELLTESKVIDSIFLHVGVLHEDGERMTPLLISESFIFICS